VGAASAEPAPVVTVTNAKLLLSKPSVATGTTALTVLNRSTGFRRVRIGPAQTALLKPGAKVTLKVTLASPGAYTVVASGGKIRLTATLRAAAVVPAGVSGSTTTTPTTSPQGNALASCARPVSTTVSVTLDDGKFTFSPGVAPCGTVTFSLTNVGKYNHSLNLESSGVQSGALAPGQSEKLTVPLGPGSVTWVDGVYETDLGGDAGTYAISG
jgi:hypothetical protein